VTDLVVVATVVAIAAAVRSTWSPCGLSMLSTITPLGERGRGRRYAATTAWFVAGAVLGGATLGASAAVLALGVGALHWPGPTTRWAAVVVCMLAAVSDAGVRGMRLPVHHRQVNERWLDQFRPWVYGMGFGWQIGSGLATYVMTAGVYLVIALGALSGSAAAAVALAVVFGTVRGLAVFLGRHITGTDALVAFHRRFVALGPASRRMVVGVEAAAAGTLALAVWWPLVPAVAVIVAAIAVAVVAVTGAGIAARRARLARLGATEVAVGATAR
jgi:hypothetical protein